MEIRRLEGCDAFVSIDMPEAERSAGLIRCAPKVLTDSASLLARDATYMHALAGVAVGGASVGVNARGDDRPGAVAAAVEALRELAGEGLVLDPGKGIEAEDLAPLRDLDWRPELCVTARDQLIGHGAAGAVDALTDGSAPRVALEVLNEAAVPFASALIGTGAAIVAVGTGDGVATSAGGFGVEDLAAAVAEHGPQAATNLPGAEMADEPVWATEADVLAVGSKPGALDHVAAAGVRARAVVAIGPVPVTARAIATLRRQDTVVLGSFVTLGGPLAVPDGEADLARACETARRQVAETTAGVLAHPEGAYLGACEAAEATIQQFWGRLPFGRPMA